MKKMIKRLAAVFCAGTVLLSCSVTAAAEGDAPPLPYGDTVLPSGMTVAEFSQTMDKLAETNNINKGTYAYASAEVGIFKGDDTIFTGYYGKVNYADDIPADENSVYEWGSITKTFVWVSVMQLWEQGRIDLDRDVREYLPDGFFRHLSYDDPITMQNLMDHNAGWQETVRPVIEKTDSIRPLEKVLQDIEPAQVNRPGEVVAYSNYGAAVAGYVVECITGQPFSEYVHENIFRPLGMEHTSISPDHSDNTWVMQQRGKTHSYTIDMMFENLIDYGSKLEYVEAYPAGAAAGTLDDMMTYGKALMSDDAPLFRDKATQEKLYSGSLFYGDSDIPMWSNGFECIEYGVRVYGHSGSTYFGQANLLFDRDSKTGVAVFVNERNGNAFLSETPAACFGILDPDKYGTDSGDTFEPSAHNYVVSRSWHRGMMSYLPVIQSPNLNGKAVRIADGAYQIISETGSERIATVIGVKKTSDGRLHIQQPSIEAISDSSFLIKLCLLTAYALTVVAAFYMLRIRRKMKRSHRLRPVAGSAAMTAAHWARFLSGILLLSGFVVFSTKGGMSFPLTAVLGTAQGVCFVLCGIGAVTALISIGSKKEKARTWLYAAHAAANTLCAAGIAFFELYRFTGI